MSVTINGTTGVSLCDTNAVPTAALQAGAVTTAKITDGNVTPVKTQVGVLPSMVRVNSVNGFGSAATMIRKFTNVTNGSNGCVIQGSDITAVNDATNGFSATVNAAGVYAVSFHDNMSAAGYCGLSVNAPSLTTTCGALAPDYRLAMTYQSQADSQIFMSWTGYLAAGSVVRPHTHGISTGTIPASTSFTIVRVA